jgi:hypothetical protein
VRPKQRRDRLYNVRLNSEEDERFKRVADHHNLDVSQMIRMLVARAARDLGGPPSPADRAAAAWTKAHTAFLLSGLGETLQRIIVAQDQVRATLAALDKVIAGARECGETDVAAAVSRFRDAVAAFPQLHNQERSQHVREFIALIGAYAEASYYMFMWACRRAAV